MTGQGTYLGAMSMRELLRMEVDSQSRVLIDNLLALERGELTDRHMEALMRAAHSMKGGARIADLPPAVELAHVLEDLFVEVRAKQIPLQRNSVDLLLKAVDLLIELAHAGAVQDNLPEELVERAAAMQETLTLFARNPQSNPPIDGSVIDSCTAAAKSPGEEKKPIEYGDQAEKRGDAHTLSDRTVRVSVDSMNRLLALTGELSVKNKAASVIRAEAFQARRRMREAQAALSRLKRRLNELDLMDFRLSELDEIDSKIVHLDEFLSRNIAILETHDSQTASITRQMQREVITHRMRPFGDSEQGFRRLVRHLEQTLGKEVLLEIRGTDVGVDRDILERLNAPLAHLIQNAVDHGIEGPEERLAADKPAAGAVKITAQHRGGLLLIVVEDDGRGINLEQIRQAVVTGKHVSEAVAASLQEHELIEFLFLPNFSMSMQLSDISGRGVGLDLVRHTLREVRGTIRVSTEAGRGTHFEITLPVTLIVVRCLVVEIAGELFALPVGRIERALQAKSDTVKSLENRQYLMLDGNQAGLVMAAELLELSGGKQRQDELAVVMLAKDQHRYGLVVDRLIGERQLVEKPLDIRLGKVEGVTSVSVIDDGSPVLILDVDDLLQSIERLAGERVLRKIGVGIESELTEQGKRILVVDDSITVREVERGLLGMHGYTVDVAVDGAEGWNALRTRKYDLVVTDVDMPRMNGIELVKLIRADSRLKDLPVIIVSYKDRDEDRLDGLDAGADRYLTKGSFEDDTFIHTVSDLIGSAS